MYIDHLRFKKDTRRSEMFNVGEIVINKQGIIGLPNILTVFNQNLSKYLGTMPPFLDMNYSLIYLLNGRGKKEDETKIYESP